MARKPRILGFGPAVGLAAVIAVLGVGLDQLTKQWAIAELVPYRDYQVVGRFFQLKLVRNPGAAFSLGSNTTWLFTVLSSVVFLGIIWVVCKYVRALPWILVFGLFQAGILGNLADRIFRWPAWGQGHVVDFLYLTHWPIFNVADCFICIAAAFMACLSWWGDFGLDGKSAGES